MPTILVLRGGALGDFIVTLPALALLRTEWPQARIELAGNPTAGVLAKNRGLVDVVHSQHDARWSPLFTAAPLPASLQVWLGEFDFILNFWPDPDGDLARHFPVREGQVFLTAPAMPQQAPAAAHYCAPLRQFGLRSNRFWFPLEPLQRSPAAEPRAIAIHPGSGSPKKNWPAENWRELLNEIPVPVLLVLGEAEAASWESLATPGITVARNLPLEELLTALAGCRHFVGHDSGISHLAAATGIPCTLLFGPTDPAMWAPPATYVQVLRHGPELGAISVAEVKAAVVANEAGNHPG